MESSPNKRPSFLPPGRSSLAIVALCALGLITLGTPVPLAASTSQSLTLSGFVSPSTSIDVTSSHDLEAIDLENGGTSIEIARIFMRVNNGEALKLGVKSHNGNILMHQDVKGPSYTLNIETPTRTREGRSLASGESNVILKMNLEPMPQDSNNRTTKTFSDTLVFSISAL